MYAQRTACDGWLFCSSLNLEWIELHGKADLPSRVWVSSAAALLLLVSGVVWSGLASVACMHDTLRTVCRG
jgi:hypothetical protein